jgi:hypothetical protein
VTAVQEISVGVLVVLIVLVIRGTWGHRKRYNDDGDNWQSGGESGGDSD